MFRKKPTTVKQATIYEKMCAGDALKIKASTPIAITAMFLATYLIANANGMDLEPLNNALTAIPALVEILKQP